VPSFSPPFAGKKRSEQPPCRVREGGEEKLSSFLPFSSKEEVRGGEKKREEGHASQVVRLSSSPFLILFLGGKGRLRQGGGRSHGKSATAFPFSRRAGEGERKKKRGKGGKAAITPLHLFPLLLSHRREGRGRGKRG